MNRNSNRFLSVLAVFHRASAGKVSIKIWHNLLTHDDCLLFVGSILNTVFPGYNTLISVNIVISMATAF